MFLTNMSNSVQIKCYLLLNNKHIFMYNFIIKKLKLKYLIDDIVINFWYFWNFVSMENIIKTFRLTIRFSKFTSNLFNMQWINLICTRILQSLYNHNCLIIKGTSDTLSPLVIPYMALRGRLFFQCGSFQAKNDYKCNTWSNQKLSPQLLLLLLSNVYELLTLLTCLQVFHKSHYPKIILSFQGIV